MLGNGQCWIKNRNWNIKLNGEDMVRPKKTGASGRNKLEWKLTFRLVFETQVKHELKKTQK